MVVDCMGKEKLKREISKKLKEKWGYNKQDIRAYWQIKKDLTIEELKKELEEI